MAATVECKCDNCRKPFVARVADRKRGWARFCSKSCKALKQERRTGQCADYFRRQSERDCVDLDDVDISDLEWGASDGDSGPVMHN